MTGNHGICFVYGEWADVDEYQPAEFDFIKSMGGGTRCIKGDTGLVIENTIPN